MYRVLNENKKYLPGTKDCFLTNQGNQLKHSASYIVYLQ